MGPGQCADGGECWICLDASPGSSNGALVKMCRCPSRFAHAPCLAQWQLYSAGKSEEKHCRFCDATYPDWRTTLTPAQQLGDASGGKADGAASSAVEQMAAPAPAFMRISWAGKSHKIRVQPGQEGTARFVLDCRRLLDIPDGQEFDVVFHCRAPQPLGGGNLHFKGLDAYDAAVHCASLASTHTPARSATAPTISAAPSVGEDGLPPLTSPQPQLQHLAPPPPAQDGHVRGGGGSHSSYSSGGGMAEMLMDEADTLLAAAPHPDSMRRTTQVCPAASAAGRARDACSGGGGGGGGGGIDGGSGGGDGHAGHSLMGRIKSALTWRCGPPHS